MRSYRQGDEISSSAKSLRENLVGGKVEARSQRERGRGSEMSRRRERRAAAETEMNDGCKASDKGRVDSRLVWWRGVRSESATIRSVSSAW